MKNQKTTLGLTTQEALNILHYEIKNLIVQYKFSQNKKSRKRWLRDSLHRTSQYTTINWISVCLLIISIISLNLVSIIKQTFIYFFESLLILLFLILSLGMQMYENFLRHEEIYRRIENVLETLSSQLNKIVWDPENYPSLFMPASPCITLQWTYRDGKLVNLPYPLLVKDDIINVRPGQSSPGYCECLDKHSEQQILHDKEIYAPLVPQEKDILATPRIRKPIGASKYKLLETPFLKNIKIMLDQALQRPVTYVNHQQHVLMVEVVQTFILPFMIIFFYGSAALKFFYYNFDNYSDLYLLTPIAGILPLLPLIFPVVWNLLNYVGLARLQTIFSASKDIQNKESYSLEEEAEATIVEYMQNKHKWFAIFTNFKAILKGSPEILSRTANILHVLGSVTALCCVDKKGILSWPNPTAEKVFFLHNNNISPASSLVNVGDLELDSFGETPSKRTSDSPRASACIEVLDLTHNHHDPFKLHFDDPNWESHLSSLKPLGLAMLLNTCNLETEEHYNNFCSYLTCEAIYSENLVPVTNRRCLCELAAEIGFISEAQKVFNLEEKLCTFRHLLPETVRRDNKYARSLQMSNAKVKVPFPHTFSVVVKEISTGAMQLLSEGTADILLDMCFDYWDGKDVCQLTSADRKRIQDFYQRTSLTAYCTAFAYRPMNRAPASSVASSYLELSSDSKNLYLSQRSPTSILGNNKGFLEPLTGHSLPLFYSTDSLLYGHEMESEEIDAEGCFQIQCNQVFIGMVSMQYQVLTDMVHLIEQLERACIRFVHFSKENELRSRVFSEKMGLESGWNCHISLLSEKNSTNLENTKGVSVSAPSMINLDQATVRFDTEIKEHTSVQSNVNESDQLNQESSMLLQSYNTSHDWQSMSCLTDSTDQSAPIHFDMSNRAKLPRGIDKIRPHIEQIDNVPLLVSLFTDCTSSATREMLQIMQEYGEIVCIMGSSANCENTGIFMQADASVAIEPLYPQVCQKRDLFNPASGLSPIDLAREISSLACSFCMKREDPINLYHLIMESRHFVLSLWNTVQFWVCCCATLTGIQLICTLGFLPCPFSVGQILWLIIFVIPLISASLAALPVETDVMKQALGKNNIVINWDIFIFICWCYGSKFLPTIVTTIVVFWGTLSYHCEQYCLTNNCTCFLHHMPYFSDGNSIINWNFYWAVESIRPIILLLFVVHIAIISISFVHRGHLVFRKLPHTNQLWLVTVLVLITAQCIYTYLAFDGEYSKKNVDLMPLWVFIVCASSPFCVFFINELVKTWEIGVNSRFQKRARLDFGTKLGMNSPF